MSTHQQQEHHHDDDHALAVREEANITTVDVGTVGSINRSEIQAQLDAAHRYPRKQSAFLAEAVTLATISRQVAESCIYALPRGGKTIAGPSVRLAEICASAWGNLQIGARVIGLDDEGKMIIAQGIAWDMEKNTRISVEARRRVTGKGGKRYDDDMVAVTGAAAMSIALRNAVFRIVPRALVDTVYARVREVAVGNASTLADRRQEVVNRLQKMGVPVERIFARVGAKKIDDVGLDELEVLIGLGTRVKQKESSIDEAFPPPDTTADRTASLTQALAQGTQQPAVPPAQPQAQPVAAPQATASEPKVLRDDQRIVEPPREYSAPTQPAQPKPRGKAGMARDGSDGSVPADQEPPMREPGEEG